MEKELFNQIYELASLVEPIDKYRNGKDRFFWIRESEKKESIVMEDTDIKWYGVYLAEFEGNRGLFLNKKLLIDSAVGIPATKEVNCLLQWILEEVQNCIKMLKEGTYNPYIKKNLPYTQRCGIIRSKEYWKYDPDYFRWRFGKIDEKEKKEFIKWVRENENKTQYGIPKITSGIYFSVCAFLYELLGANKEIDPGMMQDKFSPKEQYLMLSDGRDGHLRELDENSAKEFDRWLTNGYYEEHVWEFCECPLMTLRVIKEGKHFSFFLWCQTQMQATIHYTLELIKKGIPVYTKGYSQLADKLEGEEIVGVESQGGPSCELDYRWQMKNHVIIDEYTMLPSNYSKELIRAIQWEEIPEIHLIGE